MVENIFDKIKKRSQPAANVKVPFLHYGKVEEAELTLEIEVMGYGEAQEIERKTSFAFARENISNFNPMTSIPFAIERACQAWDHLYRHTINWTHKPKDGASLEFSKEALKDLFYPEGGYTQYDKFLIYKAYLDAVSISRTQAEGNGAISAKDL